MISSLTNSTQPYAAADPSTLVQRLFARLDQDGDGKISSDEFATAMQKRYGQGSSAGTADGAAPDFAAVFKKLDTDADGKISADEFKTGVAQVQQGLRQSRGHHHHHDAPDLQKIFAAADADQNGTVSAAELQANFDQTAGAGRPGAAKPDFNQIVSALDQNGDGVLSETEFTAARGPAQPPGANQAGDLFQGIDVDRDGSITLDEFKAALEAKFSATSSGDATTNGSPAAGTPDFSRLFASFDSDQDGTLSASELQAMLDQARLLEHRDRNAIAYDSTGAKIAAPDAQTSRLDTQG